MTQFIGLRIWIAMGILFVAGLGAKGQENSQFRKELFQRADDLAKSVEGFRRWDRFERPRIIHSPEQHPNAERLNAIRNESYPNDMKRIEAVADYLIMCGKCGVIERTIPPLRNLKLSEEVFRATMELGLCCGFFGDRESYLKLVEFVSSWEGKPFIAYADEAAGTASEREANDKVVARKASSELTEFLKAELRCLFYVGQAKSLRLSNGWRANVQSKVLRDVIRLQRFIKACDEDDYSTAIDCLARFENRAILERANYELHVRLDPSKDLPVKVLEIAEKVFSVFLNSDLADGILHDEGVAEFIINLNPKGYRSYVANFARELLNDDVDSAIESEGMLKFAMVTGITTNGLDLLSKFTEEGRQSWASAVYSQAMEVADHQTMMTVWNAVALEDQKQGIGRSLEQHRRLLVQAAAVAGDYEKAEEYLTSILDKPSQQRGKLLIVAYRNNEQDQTLLKGTLAAKKFLTAAKAAPKEEFDRMKWIVNYTMTTGWNEWGSSGPGEAAVDDRLLFARNEILDAFEDVASGKETRRWVDRHLNSFTPPSDQAKVILEDMLKQCGGPMTQLAVASTEVQVIKQLRKLESLNKSEDLDAKTRLEKGARLYTLINQEVDKLDLSSESLLLHDLAVEFARLGHQVAVDGLLQKIGDREERALALLECSLAFPPVRETMYPSVMPPRTLGGGMF